MTSRDWAARNKPALAAVAVGIAVDDSERMGPPAHLKDRWAGERGTAALAGSCAAMSNSLDEMADEFRPSWIAFWASPSAREREAIGVLENLRRTLVGRCAGGAQPDPGISQLVREALVYKGQENAQAVINVIKANRGLLGFGLGSYTFCGSACR